MWMRSQYADHDDADVERLARGLLGLQLVVEVVRGRCRRARDACATPARASVAGEELGEAAQEALGERVAVGLQLVDVALGEGRDVAGAGGLLLGSRRQGQRRRQQRPRRQQRLCERACPLSPRISASRRRSAAALLSALVRAPQYRPALELTTPPCGSFPATARCRQDGAGRGRRCQAPPLRSRCSSSSGLGWPSSARSRPRWVARMAARVRSPMMPSRPPVSSPHQLSRPCSSSRSARVSGLSSAGQACGQRRRRRRCGRRGGRPPARRRSTGCSGAGRGNCPRPGTRARARRRAARAAAAAPRAAFVRSPAASTPAACHSAHGPRAARRRPGVVEVGRQGDLAAPGRAGGPARGLEIVGGRGQRVGHRLPDVAPAVLVEVDRVRGVGRGDELRVAHGAGPGADERLGRGRVVLQQAQRRQQLPLPEARRGAYRPWPASPASARRCASPWRCRRRIRCPRWRAARGGRRRRRLRSRRAARACWTASCRPVAMRSSVTTCVDVGAGRLLVLRLPRPPARRPRDRGRTRRARARTRGARRRAPAPPARAVSTKACSVGGCLAARRASPGPKPRPPEPTQAGAGARPACAPIACQGRVSPRPARRCPCSGAHRCRRRALARR